MKLELKNELREAIAKGLYDKDREDFGLSGSWDSHAKGSFVNSEFVAEAERIVDIIEPIIDRVK